jgi:Protein of unknown function (DUF2550)
LTQIAWALGLLLALAVLAFAGLAIRRRILRRQGGTFDCSMRLKVKRHGQGWVYGIARYRNDGLEWYRVFSFSLRAHRSIPRRDLSVRGRRAPKGPEVMALLPGSIVVECGDAGRPLELAMSPDAMTGFLAWLEAAPPGHHLVA